MSKESVNKKYSSLENKLLEYARNHQPVLLYGKDTFGREDLIRNVHLENGGIDYSWESVESSDAGFKNDEDMKKLIDGGWGAGDNFATTPRTWICIDCSVMNGKEIFETLTYSYQYFSESNDYYSDRVARRGKSKPSWSPYINRKSLVFVNNLHCKSGDNDDKYYYEKLASIIETRRNDNPDSGFVVYTYNPNPFPPYFLEQFSLVSLDSERAVAESGNELGGLRVGKRRKRKQRISDNKFKQLCKDVKEEKGTRGLLGNKVFFKEVEKKSKQPKYDESGRGYTKQVAKKRYYEVFPSRKANQ